MVKYLPTWNTTSFFVSVGINLRQRCYHCKAFDFINFSKNPTSLLCLITAMKLVNTIILNVMVRHPTLLPSNHNHLILLVLSLCQAKCIWYILRIWYTFVTPYINPYYTISIWGTSKHYPCLLYTSRCV